MIRQKEADAKCTCRFSTWPAPVGYFFPEFAVEVAMAKIC